MTRWELIKTLRQHIKLSAKRNVAFNQNKVGKAIMYFGAAFTILYLMFISVMLALIANSSESRTACELMFGLMPFIFAVDFFFRFMAQQTPSQQIKPYVLLPISKYACIECFIFNSVTSSGNLIWFALFLPYSIMSVVFSEGFVSTIGFLLAIYLIILISSQLYMLVRTLINQHSYWWAIPAVIFAAIFSPWYIGHDASIVKLCETYAPLGDMAARWSPLLFIPLLLVLALLILINRRVQYATVYAELSRQEKTTLRHVSQLNALDRYGELGEYLKLEIKSIMRNKNIRRSFISVNILVLVFSLLISFTDIYDGGMTIFLCVYNFAIYGATILVRTMCYEGNYIECLMVHKENIISLLKAKYFFYALLLLVPFILMIPVIVMDKCSLMMMLSVMLLTAGPIYCIFLHMAIYNKQTIPLNTKFIGKGTVENNYIQLAVEMAALFIPPIVIGVLPLFMDKNLAYVLIALIGIGFILANKYWIRNIYVRMMRRRYENMESFRASR
jgi:hypothetical protein